jgi:hypothetical protein
VLPDIVAQAPASRIVYVDNDPLVLTHARALLTSTPEGATDYLDADMRAPGAILAGARKTVAGTRTPFLRFQTRLRVLNRSDVFCLIIL